MNRPRYRDPKEGLITELAKTIFRAALATYLPSVDRVVRRVEDKVRGWKDQREYERSMIRVQQLIEEDRRSRS